MAKKHKGLLVTVDGPIVEVMVGDYRDMQRVIGCDCFTSMPWLFDDMPACYVDDEGKINGSRPNRAIVKNGKIVDIAFGNMLFLGFDPNTGETRDIMGWEEEVVYKTFSNGEECGPGSGMRAILAVLVSDDDGKKGLVERGKL